LYPAQSSSATAANNLARCFFAAGGTSFIEPLINKVGEGTPFYSLARKVILLTVSNAGLAFTILALLNIAFTPLILLEWRYGMQLRQRRARRLAAAAKLKADAKA
jgi:hypothetical protein